MEKIILSENILNRWLNKVERDDICKSFGFKAVSFLTDFKKLLETSGYCVEHKKSYTNLYMIVSQE